MHVIGRRDGHGIDVILHLVEHLAKILELGCLGKVLVHAIEGIRIDVAERHDLSPLFGRVLGIAVTFSPHADAGDADFGIQVLAADDRGSRKNGTRCDPGIFEELSTGGWFHGSMIR